MSSNILATLCKRKINWVEDTCILLDERLEECYEILKTDHMNERIHLEIEIIGDRMEELHLEYFMYYRRLQEIEGVEDDQDWMC